MLYLMFWNLVKIIVLQTSKKENFCDFYFNSKH